MFLTPHTIFNQDCFLAWSLMSSKRVARNLLIDGLQCQEIFLMSLVLHIYGYNLFGLKKDTSFKLWMKYFANCWFENGYCGWVQPLFWSSFTTAMPPPLLGTMLPHQPNPSSFQGGCNSILSLNPYLPRCDDVGCLHSNLVLSNLQPNTWA